MTKLPSKTHAAILLACALAGFATTTASLASPAEPEGAWAGVVSSTSRAATRVEATFAAKRVTLHFGEPANCTLTATVLESDDQATRFRFHPSTNGGSFCAKLYPGEVTVTSDSQGAMTLVFHRADAVWSGALRPAVAP